MKNICIKSIILGVITVLGLDMLCGTVSVLIFTKNMSPGALRAVGVDNNYLVAAMVSGTLTTVVGGYVAAKIGRLAPYKNASVLGIVGIIFGILMASSAPLWLNVFGFLTTVPASLLGAYIFVRKSKPPLAD